MKKSISIAIIISFITSLFPFQLVIAENPVHPLGCMPPREIQESHLSPGVQSYNASTLPSSVDLSTDVPSPGDQASQGSCVAWAVAYAYKTYQEKMDHLWNINTTNHIFSPSFVYNQINDWGYDQYGNFVLHTGTHRDEGSWVEDAMDLLIDRGVCSLADMPYNQYDYSTTPNPSQIQAASQFKALDWNYINEYDRTSMKGHLSDGDPIVITIPVYSDFDNISSSNPVYDNMNSGYRGRHAICLTGYDDNIGGTGGYKFINSWGSDWGLNGYGYISYNLVEQYNSDIWSFVMTDQKTNIPVTSVNLNKQTTTITSGQSETLTATVLPSNASNKNVIWSSNNTSVATVDSSGNVTGHNEGTAVITATTVDQGLTSTCSVSVIYPTPTQTPSPAQDFTFDDSTGTITGYTGPGGDVVIPSEINGVSVTKISYDAFNSKGNITNVSIPSSVTSIDDYSFICCSSLLNINVDSNNLNYSSIDGVLFNKSGSMLKQYPNGRIGAYVIPNNVTSMGWSSFAYTLGLTEITFPNSMTVIPDYAFEGCTGLLNINLSNNITNIEAGAFRDCNSLERLDIPGNVENIGSCAFAGCLKLQTISLQEGLISLGNEVFGGSKIANISLPSSLTSISSDTFLGYDSLNTITVNPTNSNFSSQDGVLFDKNGTKIIQYPNAKPGSEYIVPNSVENIDNYAFWGCKGLTKVTLQDGVICIGSDSFYCCDNLSSVIIPSSVTTIGDGAFISYTTTLTIHTPAGSYAQSWAIAHGILYDNIIPTPTPSPAQDFTFDDSTGTITGYTGPGGVVVIPSSINGINVINIGERAFVFCDTITSITILYGVSNIDYNAFGACTNLDSITIPNSVTSIGVAAFADCNSLSTINLPNSINNISNQLFISCYDLKEITIPSSIESIGDQAFSGTGLESITIPNSVTTIGENAFFDSQITNLTIPESVITIGNGAFGSCHALANIDVNANNPNYSSDNGVFFDKNKSTLIMCPEAKTGDYTIPESVGIIKAYSFANSTLSNVYILNSNVIIEENAFYECPNLTIHYPQTPAPSPVVTTILNDDFNGYTDINSMQTAGWTFNFGSTTAPTPTTPALITTAAPQNAQYLKVYASTNATRTFAPVALKSAGGASPGKNAKLIISFDAYIAGRAGADYQSYFKIDDSNSNVAVAAGRRNASSNPIYYSKSIPSTGDKGLAITSSTLRFTKLKYVIKITDDTGAFLTTGPKVDIYADNMDTPIAGGVDLSLLSSETTFVNRFYMGGSEPTIEVDNLNISLETTV